MSDGFYTKTFAGRALVRGLAHIRANPRDQGRLTALGVVCGELLAKVIAQTIVNGWPQAEQMPAHVAEQLRTRINCLVAEKRSASDPHRPAPHTNTRAAA